MEANSQTHFEGAGLLRDGNCHNDGRDCPGAELVALFNIVRIAAALGIDPGVLVAGLDP